MAAPRNSAVTTLTTDFLERTSSHGLPRIASEKSKFRKGLWLLIFLAASGYFISQVTQLIVSYFEYPVAVKTVTIERKMMQFPAVTFCNLNILKKSAITDASRFEQLRAIDELNENYLTGLDLSRYFPESTTEDSTVTRSAPNTVTSERNTMTSAPNTMTSDTNTATSSTSRRRKRGTGKESNNQFIAEPEHVPDQFQPDGPPLLNEDESNVDSIETVSDHDQPDQGHPRDRRYIPPDYGSGDSYPDPYYDPYADGAYPDPSDPDRTYSDEYGAYSGDYSSYQDGSEYAHYDMDYSQRDTSESAPATEKSQFVTKATDAKQFFGIQPNDFKQAYMRSKTSDYSDVTSDIFPPTAEELLTHGHMAEDFILQCSFDGVECSYKDFVMFHNRYYGNCYTYNTNIFEKNASVLMTGNSGSRYGLQLTLNIENDDYIGMLAHKVGARVAVHPHDEEPFPEDHGLSVSPGMRTEIGVVLRRRTRERAPHPSNCTGKELDEKNTMTVGAYTPLACRRACVRDNILETCGCLSGEIPSAGDTVCSVTNATQELCRRKVTRLFYKDELGCVCPPSCLELYYDTSVSSTAWPSQPYSYMLLRRLLDSGKMKQLANHLVYPGMRNGQVYISDQALERNKDAIDAFASKNLARVVVYIADTRVLSVNEYASYPWDRLVADIGGLLGLFIGVSICTAIEILEYVFDLIVLVTCRRALDKNKKVQPMATKKSPLPASVASAQPIKTIHGANQQATFY